MYNKYQKKIFQFTGLSGVGKTTLARSVEKVLMQHGYGVDVLDGDEIRKTLSSDLGFSREDRLENMKRIADCALHSKADVVLIAVINPYHEGREYLWEHCRAELVWLRCAVEVLKERDTKGLYKKASLPDHDPRKLKNLTGVNDPFQDPECADIILDTDQENIACCTGRLFNYIAERLKNCSDFPENPTSK